MRRSRRGRRFLTSGREDLRTAEADREWGWRTTVSVPKPRCFYHPDREAYLFCGRCGRPLCPDCVHHGPTGVRCRECITPSPRARGVPSPRQVRNASLAALGTTAAAGTILGLLSFVNLLSTLALGFAVGSAAWLAAGRHRGVQIQVAAGAAALLGVLLAVVVASAEGAQELARALINVPYWRFVVPTVGAVAGAIIRFVI